MYRNRSVRSIGIALALMSLLSLAAVAGPSTAAQDQHGRWSRTHMSRFAYALGYTHGYDDASQGSYHSYREIQRWREGTEGWEDPMGTRNSFRDNFRRGFSRGFMDARSHRTRRYTQSDVDRIRAEANEGRPHRP
jgi:hypothetical protein